jgi:glucokinase
VADLYRRDALSGEAAGELARRGDELALAAVHEVAEWLGIGLASYANIFNPQMIVVGGGLGTLGELLLAPARRVMREYGLSPNRDVVTVASASLGNSAGALGAGLAAWEELVPSP